MSKTAGTDASEASSKPEINTGQNLGSSGLPLVRKKVPSATTARRMAIAAILAPRLASRESASLLQSEI